LEPIQTAASLDGQIEELRAVLETYGSLPITLVGFSWGAWLSYVLAARYPVIVKKLILVGSGPFEEKYVATIQETRLSRLSEAQRAEFESTVRTLNDPATKNKDILLARLRQLASRSDAYDPITNDSNETVSVGTQSNLFQSVWKDAAELRRSGRLLELGKHIACPAVAIHGDYDPHPADGVQKPLAAVLKDFRFILLKTCGHTPWMERKAKDRFYEILREELREGNC
jgi:pimeloyl-ACP methyl ester carboxylesterase